MKYAFLTSRTALVIIGLIVGLYGGFKVANSQYRLAQEKDLNRSIAGATSGLPTGSAGAGMDQTRQMIDRAKNNPQDIEAQLDAADQFMQISRPDQALPFLQQAHQIDQQDPRALAGLGMASFMSGNYDQAIDWASRSLSIRPENPGASFLLIASYIRTNQKLDPFAATYWPWVKVRSQELGRDIWSPASTVLGGVFAFNDKVGAEWFAPAGLLRGGIPGVTMAARKLSQSDRDSLYLAKVNPLATFPGTGVVAYGQKTLQTKSSALDRVNVRRLLINLKNFIGDQANNLVFEQNTITTRNRFLALVNPYLDTVVQRQGLYAYRVVMDDTNNTADVIDRNQLIGQIFIQPTKTAEFIVLDFVVQPTGATFNV